MAIEGWKLSYKAGNFWDFLGIEATTKEIREGGADLRDAASFEWE